MAETCYCMADTLYLGEAWLPVGTVRYADAAQAHEEWRGERSLTFADTLQAGEAWLQFHVAVMADALTLGEAWTLEGDPAYRYGDTLRAREAWRTAGEVRMQDTLTAGEQWALHATANMADTVQVAEAWLPQQAPVVRMADHVHVAEVWAPVRVAQWADTLDATEAWRFARELRHSDALTLGEAWHLQAGASTRMEDVLRFGEAWQVVAAPQVRMADDLFADGDWFTEGPRTSAWTANTDSWGASRYEDWPYTSLCVIDGVLHGAGPGGLYRLDAADDSGSAIAGSFTTGMTDHGGEHERRPRMLYAGARVEGRLQATVQHVTARTPDNVTYTFEPRPATDFAPQRVKLGRGLRSRYLAFTVGNVAGADFTIDSLSLMADASSRRV